MSTERGVAERICTFFHESRLPYHYKLNELKDQIASALTRASEQGAAAGIEKAAQVVGNLRYPMLAAHIRSLDARAALEDVKQEAAKAEVQLALIYLADDEPKAGEYLRKRLAALQPGAGKPSA